jgi:Ca-activated chloride channel family protein
VRWIKYSKYTGDDLGLSAEDLLQALSDFFLQSGFHRQSFQFSEWNQNTLEDLKRAIERALQQGEMFHPDQAERIAEQLRNMSPELRSKSRLPTRVSISWVSRR